MQTDVGMTLKMLSNLIIKIMNLFQPVFLYILSEQFGNFCNEVYLFPKRGNLAV